MSVVGFNNLSKRKAIAEQSDNSPQSTVEIPTSQLQAETLDRVKALSSMIMSPKFSSLPSEQKQMMLIDFAYFKNVADTL